MNAPLLSGKVSIITGAAAGIGRSAALIFAREGGRVVVSDVNEKDGHETVKMIEAAGGKAIFVGTDVSKSADVRNLIGRTVDTYGRLDCAFNNAGIEGGFTNLLEATEENFDRTIAINLKGTFLCMQAEIAAMLRGGGGTIVNMSSVAGLVGFPTASAYVASKHGVLGLTKTAALEYATQNIRVNAVCPGVIHTAMIDRITGNKPEVEQAFVSTEPMARMGTPEEIGEVAAWLCSDRASFMTGACLPIDGGFVAR